MPSSVVGGLAFQEGSAELLAMSTVVHPGAAHLDELVAALIIAAWPTTVISSLWPRALTRSTQNPVSGLWNVTLSTRPARASVAAVWARIVVTPSALP